MEMAYPPAQEDVLAPLIRWLNDQRKRAYHITERPDVAERRQQAVDYVLRDDASGHEAAVEVSTVWRSADAGREDRSASAATRVRYAGSLYSCSLGGARPGAAPNL